MPRGKYFYNQLSNTFDCGKWKMSAIAESQKTGRETNMVLKKRKGWNEKEKIFKVEWKCNQMMKRNSRKTRKKTEQPNGYGAIFEIKKV